VLSLISSVAAQQPVDLVCSQPVVGTTDLNSEYRLYFLEKAALLFGANLPLTPVENAIACDFTVDKTLWELNGILSNCGPAGGGCSFFYYSECCCDLEKTLESELTDTDLMAELTEEDRTIVVPNAIEDLANALECLDSQYLAECDDGIDNEADGDTDFTADDECDASWDNNEDADDTQTGIGVGSDEYFNDVKPCYVRAIKDLGILEQVYSKTTQSFFLVQKLEELEVELQHKLALEDEDVIQDFSVPPMTCTGTVNPAPLSLNGLTGFASSALGTDPGFTALLFASLIVLGIFMYVLKRKH